jgi:mannose-6-phosphate isomerase-like protein (cupin superfamily)
MIIRKNEMQSEEKTNVHGGSGKIHFTYLAPNETLRPLRLLSEVSLEPGATLGFHKHENETEFYLITGGSGVVNDNGVEKPVRSGDTVVTGWGNSHSITNTGKRSLDLYAIIVTY